MNQALAQYNARVLAVALALGGASPAIVVSLGGLVGQSLAAEKELATLPVSLLQLGLATGTVPAAMLMRRHPDGLTCPPPVAIAHHIIRSWVESDGAIF